VRFYKEMDCKCSCKFYMKYFYLKSVLLLFLLLSHNLRIIKPVFTDIFFFILCQLFNIPVTSSTLFYHLLLDLPCGFFLTGFPTKILYTISLIHTTCTAHIFFFNFIIVDINGWQNCISIDLWPHHIICSMRRKVGTESCSQNLF
jgi:hypothetical protein